jgi:hypothetical protein
VKQFPGGIAQPKKSRSVSFDEVALIGADFEGALGEGRQAKEYCDDEGSQFHFAIFRK